MAQVNYIVTFKDSIENTPITGSVVQPFYPPTSEPFSTDIKGVSTIIQTDNSFFVGYNLKDIENEPLRIFTAFQSASLVVGNLQNTITNELLDSLQSRVVTNKGLVAYLSSRGLPSDITYRAQQALRLELVKSIEEYKTLAAGAKKDKKLYTKSQTLNINIIDKMEVERKDAPAPLPEPTIQKQPDSYGFRVQCPGYAEKVFYQTNVEQAPVQSSQQQLPEDTAQYPTTKGLDAYLTSRSLPTTLDYKIQEIVRLGITTEEVYRQAKAQGKNGTYNLQLITLLEEERVPSKITEINLGVVTLDRLVADSAKEVTPFQAIDSKAIIANTPKSEKEQGLAKLRTVLEDRATQLQDTLVTAIIPVLTQFGLTEIYKLLEKAPTQELLDKAVAKAKKICPTQVRLQELILLKSRYSDQVNNFYKSITTLQTTVTSSDKIAQAINTSLQVISTARQLGNIALSFVPVTPGAPPALINVQKDIEEKLRPILEKVSTVLSKIVSTFALIGSIIALIQQLLTVLDILIRFCSEQLGIPYESINSTMGAIPNLATPAPSAYKGFTFEIKTETANTTAYPKRYAVAKDKYNIIQLRSQSSFTPNPDVLIAELRFIIDRDGLRGD